ncbi:MAG: helix-turn-helix transcriptional regulator [Elusimicrobiota bacterium]
MGRIKRHLLPKARRVLSELGENIKLARLRRKLTMAQVADRANLSRPTLWQLEKGSPRVAIGAYMQVMFVLGLEKDFLKLAQDDRLGRKIQDADLLVGGRAPKKMKTEDVNE